MTTQGAYQYHDVPRTEMVAFVPSGAGTVLDVGCGAGGFGAELRRLRPSVQVTGIESDPRAASLASARYDHMITGEFPESLDGRRFDCVVFNDVLEHMVDPWEALRQSASLLTPGGAVVASIPNLRYLMVLARLVLERDFTYVDDGVLDRTHLRFFTGRSATALFVDSGFAVERAVPINLVELSQLPPRLRRWTRLLAVVRPQLTVDLRAQQYAIVARLAE